MSRERDPFAWHPRAVETLAAEAGFESRAGGPYVPIVLGPLVHAIYEQAKAHGAARRRMPGHPPESPATPNTP